MTNPDTSIDCVYIAASAGDARYTRVCVASVRYFYPNIPIRLLVGGRLQPRLVNQLRRYWGVETADLPSGNYGWGFVKLEALFGRPGERFLVLDSDTVLVGPVLEVWKGRLGQFLVDDESQSETDTNRLYYDWQKVREIDADARPPRFVFNSGQWFGTAGVLTRDDFGAWVQWTMPRKLRHPEHFMPGDQGILNYVLNQKAASKGLIVERLQIMRWPGHSMNGLNAETVANRAAPPVIVHWAGMKKARQRDMVGADLLAFFETLYYESLPGGGAKKVLAGCEELLFEWARRIRLRARLAFCDSPR